MHNPPWSEVLNRMILWDATLKDIPIRIRKTDVIMKEPAGLTRSKGLHKRKSLNWRIAGRRMSDPLVETRPTLHWPWAFSEAEIQSSSILLNRVGTSAITQLASWGGGYRKEVRFSLLEKTIRLISIIGLPLLMDTIWTQMPV